MATTEITTAKDPIIVGIMHNHGFTDLTKILLNQNSQITALVQSRVNVLLRPAALEIILYRIVIYHYSNFGASKKKLRLRGFIIYALNNGPAGFRGIKTHYLGNYLLQCTSTQLTILSYSCIPLIDGQLPVFSFIRFSIDLSLTISTSRPAVCVFTISI